MPHEETLLNRHSQKFNTIADSYSSVSF